MNIQDKIEKAVFRIYEGLAKQAIKENASIEELDEKIDIIMDALGLENNDNKEVKVDTKQKEIEDEPPEDILASQPQIEDKENEENDVIEETEDTITVNEGLENSGITQYIITLNRDIFGYNGAKEKTFNTIDEVIDFITKELPIRRISYSDLAKIEQNDINKSEGKIFTNIWYTITKQ